MHFLLSPGDQKRLNEIVDYAKTLTSKKMVIFKEPTRSLAQNALFWDNLELIAESSGYTKYQMEAIVKQGITKNQTLNMVDHVTTSKGETFIVYRSTTELSIREFGLLIDYLYQIGALLKLQMVYPDDYKQDIVKVAQEVFG
ncbi:recombination protein NinB [Candidatus Gracilibacteria bacterium]|nr:recombination protein NinB [Candidatus Gracilibacteria bacterium]